ncbi:MAG: hypothetical protein IH616_00295 [Gemmatimonadales bacterium]|nr:hypothetical protein [Gemmatimonadales bacterium]
MIRRLPLAVLAVALVAVLGTLGVGGCDDTAGNCACTEEYRAYLVTVLDDAMQPANGVTLTRTNLRTGKVLEPTWLGMPVLGAYVVADDGLLDEFSSDGDIVQVEFAQGGSSFTTEFEFAVRAPCFCHVEKLSGPDTVVMGEPLPARARGVAAGGGP